MLGAINIKACSKSNIARFKRLKNHQGFQVKNDYHFKDINVYFVYQKNKNHFIQYLHNSSRKENLMINASKIKWEGRVSVKKVFSEFYSLYQYINVHHGLFRRAGNSIYLSFKPQKESGRCLCCLLLQYEC